jgi:hypothetical protein
MQTTPQNPQRRLVAQQHGPSHTIHRHRQRGRMLAKSDEPRLCAALGAYEAGAWLLWRRRLDKCQAERKDQAQEKEIAFRTMSDPGQQSDDGSRFRCGRHACGIAGDHIHISAASARQLWGSRQVRHKLESFACTVSTKQKA